MGTGDAVTVMADRLARVRSIGNRQTCYKTDDMTADAHLAAEFYGSARGAVTARILRERLLAMWPAAAGESLLGIGYAMPYLRLWRDQATRCLALTPAQMGGGPGAPGGAH